MKSAKEDGKWYRIEGLSPFLNGKFVFGKLLYNTLEVLKLADKNAFFGNTNKQFTLPESAFFIGRKFLIEDDLKIKFFSFSNPFGKFLSQNAMEYGTLKVIYVEFENCLQVTILELGTNVKTIFSDNFFEQQDKDVAWVLIKTVTEENIYDLAMELKNVKQNNLKNEKK